MNVDCIEFLKEEGMEKLNQLLNEKNITREDLILILKCLVLKYHNL